MRQDTLVFTTIGNLLSQVYPSGTNYAPAIFGVCGSSRQDAITKGYEGAFFLMQKAYPDAHPHYILTSTLQVFNLAMQMLKNNNASGSEE